MSSDDKRSDQRAERFRPKTARRKASDRTSEGEGRYLDGQLLIAMPVMGDPRFER